MNNADKNKNASKQNPPYIGIAIMDDFIHKIRKINPPTEPVTNNTITSWGIATKQEFILLSALKYLGIIDQRGMPTDNFIKLQAEGDAFKQGLKQVVKDAYSDFFDMYKDVQSVNRDEMIAFFMKHSNVSKKKMATVFGYLCDLAGMPNKAYSKTQKRQAAEKPIQKTIAPIARLKTRVIRKAQPQPSNSEDSEILRFAEAMKDWDAEKMKIFFDGMRETHGKKTDKQESDE